MKCPACKSKNTDGGDLVNAAVAISDLASPWRWVKRVYGELAYDEDAAFFKCGDCGARFVKCGDCGKKWTVKMVRLGDVLPCPRCGEVNRLL